jgi:hypothetical protein
MPLSKLHGFHGFTPMNRKIASCLFTTILLAAGSALAQSVPTPDFKPAPSTNPGTGNFSMLDRNRDDAVDRIEAQRDKVLMKQFEALDKDQDGRLTTAEFAAMQAAEPGKSDPSR